VGPARDGYGSYRSAAGGTIERFRLDTTRLTISPRTPTAVRIHPTRVRSIPYVYDYREGEVRVTGVSHGAPFLEAIELDELAVFPAAREHGQESRSHAYAVVARRLPALSRPPPTISVAIATARSRRLSPLIPGGMDSKDQ
jgi:hypothetical protein